MTQKCNLQDASQIVTKSALNILQTIVEKKNQNDQKMSV